MSALQLVTLIGLILIIKDTEARASLIIGFAILIVCGLIRVFS